MECIPQAPLRVPSFEGSLKGSFKGSFKEAFKGVSKASFKGSVEGFVKVVMLLYAVFQADRLTGQVKSDCEVVGW